MYSVTSYKMLGTIRDSHCDSPNRALAMGRALVAFDLGADRVVIQSENHSAHEFLDPKEITGALFWTGDTGICQIPHCDLQWEYDCRIIGQGWACVCRKHFDLLGCKTGLGFGQGYYRLKDGRMVKVLG